MKKILSLIVMLCMPLMACSTEYKAGEHYTVVDDKVSKKLEVREYFSFYCPHCFNFEPIMQNVKKDLPAGATFEMNHVDFLRAASPKVQGLLSKAIVVAQKMDMEKKMVGAIFNYLQVQRAFITSEKDIRNIFVLNGADGEQFDKLASSFSVKSLVKRNNKDIADFREHVTGVPTFIVNDKFKVKFTNDMSVDDMSNLINWLTKKQ